MKIFRDPWLSVLLGLTLVSTSDSQEDWPHWMGERHDGIWRESGMIDSFPDQGPSILWRSEVGAGYGGPAIVGQEIYLMDRIKDAGKGGAVENDIRKAGEIAGSERVLCIDMESGQTKWAYQYDCPYNIAYPTGPRCTPTVAENYVYTLGAMGDLICLDRQRGTVVWQKDLMAEYGAKPPLWGFSSHPVVDGDQLIVPVGGEGTAIVSFNRKTGQEKWRALTTVDVAYAPVRIMERDGQRQLIFWHGEGIDSLNPETGKHYWNVKFPEEKNPSITSIATPRIVGNRVFISEYYKGSLLLEVSSNPPAVKELWRSYQTDPRNETALNSMMATPVIKDGLVYGVGYNRKGEGVFRCLELETGKMKWARDDWMSDEPLMFATAFIVENDDKYFMFNDNGELMIV
ncbi:MAG: PQQ-binding-like beta-propeller repeat protein, partial [Mariniblastus sp.]|nr:PQQ-binding-like beta-propeller repeat protein [Mariniblastus sp.]